MEYRIPFPHLHHLLWQSLHYVTAKPNIDLWNFYLIQYLPLA